MLSFSLRSGSSGNSTYVGTSSARLLVDCGMSGRQLASALKDYDIDPSDIDAILLTHEHVDHCSGVGVVMRRYNLPLFLTEKTYLAVQSSLGNIDESRVHFIEPGAPFGVRDTEILPFSTPHDAVDTVGFRVYDRTGDVGVCTDLGYFSRDVRTALRGCRFVFLESNYDVDMLETGPYPRYLKQRIAGRKGHLSNDDAGKAAVWLVRYGTEALSLSHISENNNHPVRAMMTVREAFHVNGIRVGRDIILQASPRYSCSPSFESASPQIGHKSASVQIERESESLKVDNKIMLPSIERESASAQIGCEGVSYQGECEGGSLQSENEQLQGEAGSGNTGSGNRLKQTSFLSPESLDMMIGRNDSNLIGL